MTDKKSTDAFIKSMALDIKNIKVEEKDGRIKMSIGNFFLTRDINDDPDYAMKKLFEDFLTNISTFYINIFWER